MIHENMRRERFTVTPRSGRRGNRASVQSTAAVYQIEGESLTLQQIATRIGRSKATAAKRLADAAATEGPVTWEKLGLT